MEYTCHFQGVNVNAKADNGDTARSLALINGNMKIVSLIDNHVMPITSLRAEAGKQKFILCALHFFQDLCCYTSTSL